VSVLVLAQMGLVWTISLSETAEGGTRAGLAIVDSPDDLTNKHPHLWCRGYGPENGLWKKAQTTHAEIWKPWSGTAHTGASKGIAGPTVRNSCAWPRGCRQAQRIRYGDDHHSPVQSRIVRWRRTGWAYLIQGNRYPRTRPLLDAKHLACGPGDTTQVSLEGGRPETGRMDARSGGLRWQIDEAIQRRSTGRQYCQDRHYRYERQRLSLDRRQSTRGWEPALERPFG